MRARQNLRNRSNEDWIAASCHAFNTTLTGEILDGWKLQGYLRQDSRCINKFFRLLESAIAHAKVEDVFFTALWLEWGFLDAAWAKYPEAGETSR